MMMARRSWLMIGLVSVVLLALPLTAQGANPKPSKYDLILQQQIDAFTAQIDALTAKVNTNTPAYTSVHGHSGHIENMAVVLGAAFGWGLTFAQLPVTTNWVHFSIPVSQFPVYRISLKFLAGSRVTVDTVGVYNGDVLVATLTGPWPGGNNPQILNLPTPTVFQNGLGLSVSVKTGAAGSTNALDYSINFASAGALFTQ
jgi:hypothetical protein